MTEVKLLDGSFSRQLSTHVGEPIDGDPLWTAKFLATQPDAVLATHLDFLRAGCDIIETNTYQASVTGFVKYLNVSEEEGIALIKNAVNLAKKAVRIYKEETKDIDVPNKNPLIAGSCGPYGAALHDNSEYTGSYGKVISPSTLANWHRTRMKALIESGVDLLALETIPCWEEGDALVNLLKEFPTTKAWLSFSCRTDGKNLAEGDDFKTAALRCYRNALPGQLIAVGVNCIAPKYITPLIKGINNANATAEEFVPLVIYANSGENYIPEEGCWKMVKDSFPPENYVQEWLDLGVRYVGGCCRTQVSNLKKIRAEIQTWLLASKNKIN